MRHPQSVVTCASVSLNASKGSTTLKILSDSVIATSVAFPKIHGNCDPSIEESLLFTKGILTIAGILAIKGILTIKLGKCGKFLTLLSVVEETC